jgi:hypothetical protein
MSGQHPSDSPAEQASETVASVTLSTTIDLSAPTRALASQEDVQA